MTRVFIQPKNGSWKECFCNNFLHGPNFSLTPALSQKEREFSPFSLREKGWG